MITIVSMKTEKTKGGLKVHWVTNQTRYSASIKSEYIDEILPISPEFAVASLFVSALRTGKNIHSRIPLDPVFLSNVNLLVKRFLLNKSTNELIKPIVVTSDTTEMIGSTIGRRTGLFYSGGVDAMYSLIGNNDVTDIIHISNMNNPVTKEVLKAIDGIRIHQVYMPVIDATNWLFLAHGPFLASVGLLFSNYLTSMIISGTDRFSKKYDCGSGYDVDYLWSSSRMRFITHGLKLRSDKLRSIIGSSRGRSIIKHLQVCYGERQKGRINCSSCGKCLLTMLSIDSLGAKDLAESFNFDNFEEKLLKVNWNTYPTHECNLPIIIENYKKIGRQDMIELLSSILGLSNNV